MNLEKKDQNKLPLMLERNSNASAKKENTNKITEWKKQIIHICNVIVKFKNFVKKEIVYIYIF